MSFRSMLVMAMALIFGGSAAVGVRQYVQAPSAGPKQEMVPVVVAAIDVPRGGTITADLVKIREFPKDLAPTGAIATTEAAVDRAVFTPLIKDEPVLEGKLAPKGAGRGLAAITKPTMRAFTISTPNIATGVAGFILPGDRVDVLLTMTGGDNDGSGGGSTTTLLQNIEILAVDQVINAPAENKMDANQIRSVTLQVTPDQAAMLDLGQNKGTLHLSLRNSNDHAPVSTRPATLSDLRFRQEKPWDERAKGLIEAFGKMLEMRRAATPAPTPTVVSKAPEPPPPARIRTIRGSQEGSVFVQRSTSELSSR